jgi:glyoxylase-like metal-dependent hydrolase (beta-lactamase superfamily II)
LIKLTENDILAKNTITLKISRLFPVEKEIDLGNRKIKILYTPGHSKESISIIDQDNGYIFTGDLLYNGLLLIDDCQDFIGSINNILKNTGTDYRVFGSHGKPEFKYEQLAQAKKAVECYLDKACPFKPEQTINIFGRNRDVFKIDNVSFIVGYTEGFKFGK